MGPVQLLVVGFDDPKFTGEIRAELERLRENDTIRLIDLAVVQKDENGVVERVQLSDLSVEEAEELGAVIGALIGFGVAEEEGAEAGAIAGAEAGADGHILPDDVWYVQDALPVNTAAAIALIEHRWAIPLRESIQRAGGFHLADAWVHPLDLVAIGLAEATEEEAEEEEVTGA
jgi:uncharacterized membrane protein